MVRVSKAGTTRGVGRLWTVFHLSRGDDMGVFSRCVETHWADLKFCVLLAGFSLERH